MRVFTTLLCLPLALTGCPDQHITPNNADPGASITSHADGDSPDAGLRAFAGTVDDQDHAVEDLLASWLYEGEEVCPPLSPDASGNTTCEIFLESGDRTVTLQVQDPLGGLGAAIVNLDVLPYGDPWAEVTSPEAGGVYYSDQLIEFGGEVGDEADEPTDLIVSWESSLDGGLDVEAEPEADGDVIGFDYLRAGDKTRSQPPGCPARPA